MQHDYVLSTLIACMSCKKLKYITRHTGEQISNLHSPDPWTYSPLASWRVVKRSPALCDDICAGVFLKAFDFEVQYELRLCKCYDLFIHLVLCPLHKYDRDYNNKMLWPWLKSSLKFAFFTLEKKKKTYDIMQSCKIYIDER